MIPISDPDNQWRTFPLINVTIIVINVIVWVYEVTLQFAPDPNALESFVLAYGVRPLEITTGRDLVPLIDYPIYVTLVTSMFLHGGWMHIIGNMLYLWVFGDNVEDKLGKLPYLFFYLACGLGGAVAHILSDPASRIPSVGASGAIAGILAAYLVFYPHARINTVIIFGFFFIRPLPALLVIGFWIAIQLFSGLGGTADGVAYWAHIGGFFTGLLLAFPFRGKVQAMQRATHRWED